MCPSEFFDGLADVALYIGCHWTGTVVILVVAFTGIDVDEVVLNGVLYMTGHIVINGGSPKSNSQERYEHELTPS